MKNIINFVETENEQDFIKHNPRLVYILSKLYESKLKNDTYEYPKFLCSKVYPLFGVLRITFRLKHFNSASKFKEINFSCQESYNEISITVLQKLIK